MKNNMNIQISKLQQIIFLNYEKVIKLTHLQQNKLKN